MIEEINNDKKIDIGVLFADVMNNDYSRLLEKYFKNEILSFSMFRDVDIIRCKIRFTNGEEEISTANFDKQFLDHFELNENHEYFDIFEYMDEFQKKIVTTIKEKEDYRPWLAIHLQTRSQR